MASLGHKNIGGLNIAMDDSLGVGRIERICNLDGQWQQNFQFERPSRNAVLQSHAIQEFHGDERLPVLLADVVNGADVGVIQRRSSLRLTLKPAKRLRIARHFVRQKLQGDETMQPSVFGLIDNTHSAATELLDDAIVRDGLADHCARILRP